MKTFSINAAAIAFAALFCLLTSACSSGGASKDDGDADDETQELERETELETSNLPASLPFEFTRPPKGTAPTQDEITAFTKKLTAFYKKSEYFKWILRTSHGVDKSSGTPDFSFWWTGVEVIKTTDATSKESLVTFYHSPHGGPDNIMIPTSRVLAQAVAAYLLTGDADAGGVVEQYSKGISAQFMGMMFGEDDKVTTTMARAVMAHNYEVTMDGSRRKAIDYTAWQHPTTDWNTCTIEVKNNPYWGDIWVKNMRSKDDVPHIFTASAWLYYAAEYAKDPAVKAAAAKAKADMQAMGKDIVDSGYLIRTKDANGTVYVPETEDLASFVAYEDIIPNAECTSKLSSAILGYNSSMENDCGLGYGNSYEIASANIHYYNVAIFRNFHISAIFLSLLAKDNERAQTLLTGLKERIDRDAALPDDKLKVARVEWERDLSVYTLQAAAVGLPLTAEEAGKIIELYSKSADKYAAWDKWDLWASTVADGTYNYRPDDVYTEGENRVWLASVEDMAFFFELCYSPFKNKTGVIPVDCELLKDPSKW